MTLAAVVTVSAHDEVTTAVFGTPGAIDGVKDAAWNGAISIECNDLAESSIDLGEEASSTTVWSMWDGTYLYFYAEVMDSTPDGEIKDGLWDQDALGFMINYDYSTVNTGDLEAHYHNLGEDGYAGFVNVAPTFDTPEHNEPQSSAIFGVARYYDQVKSYVVAIDGGWAVEIRLPLSEYKEFAEGDKIGYEICVNESIGLGTRSGQRNWKNSDGADGVDSYMRPNNFGTLILGAAAAVEAPAETEAPGAEAEAQAEVPAEDEAEAPAETPETTETVETPVETAPQTFDAAVIAALASVLSLAGFVVSRKH